MRGRWRGRWFIRFMRIAFPVLIILLFPGACFSQEDERYLEKGYRYTPEAFINYTVEHLLRDSSDVQYISDRNVTPKLRYTTCTDTSTIISDTLVTGEKIEIHVTTKRFVRTEHVIKWRHDYIKTIDSLDPWGVLAEFPRKEIASFSITVDEKHILIPAKAYANLYEINTCKTVGMFRLIEAYSSADGQYIYVYFFGGNAAGTYHAKLVFDKNQYITSIIADYYALSIHGSFRENFVGF